MEILSMNMKAMVVRACGESGVEGRRTKQGCEGESMGKLGLGLGSGGGCGGVSERAGCGVPRVAMSCWGGRVWCWGVGGGGG